MNPNKILLISLLYSFIGWFLIVAFLAASIPDYQTGWIILLVITALIVFILLQLAGTIKLKIDVRALYLVNGSSLIFNMIAAIPHYLALHSQPDMVVFQVFAWILFSSVLVIAIAITIATIWQKSP